MQVASSERSEIHVTLEVLFAITNMADTAPDDVRQMLSASGFSRAATASAASVVRLESRFADLTALVRSLPDLDVKRASGLINEELTELAIAPAVVDHDGVGQHLHWTPSTATFDDQVLADVLMALAQELCANGMTRIGRCGAEECDDLFYDGTRNRSRRFCDDQRCASRTHTADHRARQKRSRA